MESYKNYFFIKEQFKGFIQAYRIGEYVDYTMESKDALAFFSKEEAVFRAMELNLDVFQIQEVYIKRINK